MKGVILAAGVGSRLRPITDNKPKCMVKVSGKPMLAYQLDAYRFAGIKDIIIIVGYLGEQIEEYCKNIHDLNITIIKNKDYQSTNNMYSLYLAKDLLEGEDFILNNADLVIEKDIVQLMKQAEQSNLVAVDVDLYNDESMKVVCNDLGNICDISKQISADQAKGCSIDYYKISKNASRILFQEIISTIESGNLKDWTEVALQKIFKAYCSKNENSFQIIDISGKKWVEIDNYDDLALAERLFSQIYKKIIDYKCYLFDLDGTVYVGNKPLLEVIESIKYLQSQGKIIKFLSNNSSKSKLDYVKRLEGYGLNFDINDIVLSTDATIEYLLKNQIKKIFVLGTEKLKQELIEQGFELVNSDAQIVVVGYDTELNYEKLIIASQLIYSGVNYIATHQDIFCPTENGPIPDIGALLTMLELTTKIKPLKIFGKPSVSMVSNIFNKLEINKSDILMIGDRLHTDILMASQFGIDSVLVLSGESTRDLVEISEIQPTYILNSFTI